MFEGMRQFRSPFFLYFDMLDFTELVNYFKLLVGFEQSLDTSENYLAPDSFLLNPTSGILIESEHPVLTLENLKSVSRKLYNSTENWDEETTFAIGTVVFYDQKYYTALSESIGSVPSENPTIWESKYYFSEWLEKKIEGAVRSFWTDYNSYQTARPIKKFFENKVLFSGAGSITDLVENENKLRGFEFNLKKGVGIVARLNKVGIHLTEAATFSLKLYHSSKQEALSTQEIVYTTPKSVQYFTLDWLLNYKASDFEGGSFYVLYDQTELGTAQAINKNKDWRNAPCLCNRNEFNTWKLYSATMNITPLEADTNSGNLPDIENFTYNFSENSGLNFMISSYCDLTEFYKEQKEIFIPSMLKKIALVLIRELIYNANGNLNRTDGMINKEQLMFEMKGDGTERSSKQFEYQKELKQLSIDLSGVDDSCLKCNRKGLKYGAIG